MAASERGDLVAVMQSHAQVFWREATQISWEASQLRGEVFITDQALAGGASETLAVVLHEAAHTLATQRGIKDCSSRYHNGGFRQLAAELGLHAETRDRYYGWSCTDLDAGVETRYAEPVAHLASVLRQRPANTIAAKDAPAVLSCDCGTVHRAVLGRRRVLTAGICSDCLTAAVLLPV